MKEHIVNSYNNFICGWYLDDVSICDKIVEYHGNSETFPGMVGEKIINTYSKDSIDCHLLDEQLYVEYQNALQKCVDKYVEKYKFSNSFAPWTIIHNINVQKYLPGMGFHSWHSERTWAGDITSTRHLVFMTYLNDVTDGGETEFYHQNIKIKPRKGLTLIWPVDWTFTHRGLVLNTQTKYVTTGWFNYTE
jgi:hypothetical protein